MINSASIDLLQSVIAACLWLVLLLLAVRSSLGAIRGPWFIPSRNIKQLHTVFIIILAVALLVWRAPELNFHQQYDPDESEFLTGAQRLSTDGVGWRFSDVGTSGPLIMYALSWAIPLGLPVDYFIGRLTGIVFTFLTVFFLLKSIGLLIGRRQALLTLLPVVMFYLMAWEPGFIHYSAEDLPVAMLATAIWLLLALHRKPRWTNALAFGILLGALPLTKLQVAPLGLFLFFAALASFFSRWHSRFIAGHNRIRCVWALVVGVCIVPVTVLSPVILAGLWHEFVSRYFFHGLIYGPEKLLQHPQSYFQVALYLVYCMSPFWPGLMTFGALAVTLKLFTCGFVRDRSWLRGITFSLAYLFLTIVVILMPRTAFPHYLLLLVFPTMFFVTWSIRGLLRGPLPDFFSRCRLALPIFFFSACIYPQALDYRLHSESFPRLSDRPDADFVLTAIRTSSKPNDSMAIWGYAPEYYVESGRFPATRFGVMTTTQGDIFDACRADFLSDLEKSRPALFLDATGGALLAVDNPGWIHPLEAGRYTAYPPLAEYISTHYHLKAKITAPRGLLPVLLFVRNNDPLAAKATP